MFEKFCKFIQGGCTVFLSNGVKLRGQITYTDRECLTIFKDGVTQWVNRDVIATVVPEDGFEVADIK